MLNTIALLAFICSILILFSQEIANFIKKIFAISWAALFLPLFLGSSFVVYYEPWLAWWLLEIKRGLHHLAVIAGSWITFEPTELFAIILVITICSILPIVSSYLWEKKTGKRLKYSAIISLIFWVITAILYTVSYSY